MSLRRLLPVPLTALTLGLSLGLALTACASHDKGDGGADYPPDEQVICPSIYKVPGAGLQLAHAMDANGTYDVHVTADGESEDCTVTITGMGPSEEMCIEGGECMVSSPSTRSSTTCTLVDVGGTQSDGSVRYLSTVGTPASIAVRVSRGDRVFADGTATPDYTPDKCGFIDPVVGIGV